MKDVLKVATTAADELVCPLCGADYLHHTGVEIYNRERDDDTHLIGCVNMQVEAELDIRLDPQNPSRRQSGMRIRFWCEICGEHPILNIAAHKGMTLVYWSRPSLVEKLRLR